MKKSFKGLVCLIVVLCMTGVVVKADKTSTLIYKDTTNNVEEWSIQGNAKPELKKYENSTGNGICVNYNIIDKKSKFVRFTKKIPKTPLPQKFDILFNLESINASVNLELNLKDSKGVSYKARIYLGAIEKPLTPMVVHSSQIKHVGPRKEKNIKPEDIASISFSLAPVDTRMTPEFEKVSGTVIISELKIISRMEKPANFRFGNIYSDNMVFQKGSPIKIFGYAPDGNSIKVEFNGQSQDSVSKKGMWNVTFKAMEYGGPYILKATSSDKTISLKNIMIGEVWLGSGQSNMQASFGWIFPPNAIKEVKTCYNDKIRFFTIPMSESKTPLTDIMDSDQKWEICAPETLPPFSPAGYYFAKYLHQYLGKDIAVGIIISAKGGSPIEPWVNSINTVKAIPELKNISPHSASKVGERYNAMINPLKAFDIRGAIWYQGESSTKNIPFEYRYWLKALISSWRSEWKENLPFLIVQLPNFDSERFKPESWAYLRESQNMALSLPDTGMIVTTDIGSADNIHPDNKPPIGKRLALLAENMVYDDKTVACYSPIFKSMEVKDGKIEILFSHIGNGLKVKGDKLTGFVIAGSDKNFKKAEAEIQGDKVVVWSTAVDTPVAVRYDWKNNPTPSLFNSAGLPAAPFRTDNWKK